MLFGGLASFPSEYIIRATVFFMVNQHSLLILLWLSLFSSIIQFAGWYYLLQNSDPGKTSAYLFLAPFFWRVNGLAVIR
ncbi:hypothetical protein OL548_25010 [Lysinibacillus sp. MHQ-1]|nr:hypothetical protein OL548_25010 [Lysinibacillus sp. MHQ-1]